MDCVGWVSYAIHYALGLGKSDEFTYFVTPTRNTFNYESNGYTVYDFYQSSGNWDNIKGIVQPGDILIAPEGYASKNGHVMIYVGNNQIVDCSERQGYPNAVKVRDVSTNTYRIAGYARINDSGLSKITSLNDFGDYVSPTINSFDYGGGMSEFYFNGIPDGKYSLAATKVTWSSIINSIAEIADYLIGIITYGIRIVIVGWTALVDQVISNTVNGIMGVNEDETNGISSVEIDSANNSNRLTIENLVYNLYGPLNANIFASGDED